jgi:uncharacterized surface protein with fasciclin (FAS1) repeats
MRTINLTSISAVSAVFALSLLFVPTAMANDHKDHSHAAKKSIVDIAVADKNFSTLVAALKAAGLVETLQGDGPFTVFAPTNDAFAKLPEGTVESLLKPENKEKLTAVLTYHVAGEKLKAKDVLNLRKVKTVNGQKVKINLKDEGAFANKSKIVATDIKASNGIIHVIDAVLLPADDYDKKAKKDKSYDKPAADIVGTAVKAGKFNTLAAALEAGGLVETLQGEGPFTVFAPTDDAFAKLPKETLESLLKPENKDKLVSILTYHVVADKLKAKDVLNRRALKTVNGAKLSVNIDGEAPMINESGIVATDVKATNGVIHVIDTVLLPPKGDKAEKKMSSNAPQVRELINFAINRGAPQYNMGRADACVAIYQVAVKSILEYETELPKTAQKSLKKALRSSQNEHASASDRAWTLRRAMDKTLASLDDHSAMSMTVGMTSSRGY